MVNNNKTKKKYISKEFKNTKKTIRLKRNQVGGMLESITQDKYDKRLNIEHKNKIFKTIIYYHIGVLDNKIEINDLQTSNVNITNPYYLGTDWLINYIDFYKLLNNEHKMINLILNKDKSKPLHWFSSEYNNEDMYKKDLPRTKYIDSEFFTNEHYELKNFKPISKNEKLENGKHCIDCSDDFIEGINSEDSKIRLAFKMIIPQDLGNQFVFVLLEYQSTLFRGLSAIPGGGTIIIIKDCIYKIIYIKDNTSNICICYIIMKYNSKDEHNLSVKYYFTNKFFDLINSNVGNYYSKIYHLANSEKITKKKVLIKIKDMFTDNLLREYYKKYIYYLKV